MKRPLTLEGLLTGALLFCLQLSAPALAATLRPVWQPDGPVEALLLRSGTLYIGGTFNNLRSPSGLSTVARNNLAALDWATGAPLAWDPKANGTVYALVDQGSTVFAGGSFSWAGGLTRSALAALDLTGNTAQAWNPAVSGTVRSLASNGGTLFVAGDFGQAAGTTRNALVELNYPGTTATSFDAQLSGSAISVRSMVVAGNLLYAGGSFVGAQGSLRSSLLALNKTNGNLDPWNPAWSLSPGAWFHSLFAQGGSLWVGGDFSGSLGANSVQRLAALGLTSAAPSWLPSGPDAAVLAMAPDGNGRLHVGGTFSNAAGQGRRRYASYYQSVAVLEPGYSADLNSGSTDVRALLINGTEVALGGQFTQVDAQSTTNLAVLSLPALGPVPSATFSATPSSLPTVSSTNGQAYVYPQPGACSGLKVAVPFAKAGIATLRMRSARGTLLRTQEVSAAAAGELRVALDCSGMGAGLYWMEIDFQTQGGGSNSLAPLRFVLLEEP